MSVLKSFLLGGQSIARVDDILAGLTLDAATRAVPGVPYSIYALLWHIEFTQNLLLQAVADDAGEVAFPPAEKQWPTAVPDEDAWEDLISRLRAGVYEASELAAVPQGLSERDREVLEDVAAHNAYHWGQVVLLRRLLGHWPEGQAGSAGLVS